MGVVCMSGLHVWYACLVCMSGLHEVLWLQYRSHMLWRHKMKVAERFLSSSPPPPFSSSYTHIFSQSELRCHDLELHGETLDAELEQFEQELMEGGDVMVDSKTDDDLMLEMEEFL